MLCSYFDKVYYISMPNSIGRQSHILKIFKKSSLKNCLEKFEAVVGKNIDIRLINPKIITSIGKEDVSQKTQKHYGVSLTYGSLGCALSHYLIYKECSLADKPFLIFEDDITINNNFDDMLKLVLDEILSNNIPYDILYLGLHKLSSLNKSNLISNRLCKPGGFMFGTFGMIVTPEGAQKILDCVFPLSIQIDSTISRNQDKINILALKDDIVNHNHAFGSTTQSKEGCLNIN